MLISFFFFQMSHANETLHNLKCSNSILTGTKEEPSGSSKGKRKKIVKQRVDVWDYFTKISEKDNEH